MADEDEPRLAAVVERQRRELARVRADRDAAAVTAMARGMLMERHGWSSTEAARQLAAMAAAAGLPEAEMAAAVLAQEPPSQEPLSQPASSESDTGQIDPARPEPALAAGATAHPRADGAYGAPGEWVEAGNLLGPRDDLVAMAADRATDGAELVGAVAEQLCSRFGVAAVAVWLLDADGALDLFGQHGLDGTESSRWRRLPPQFDCLEQRVVADGRELWLPAGPPTADQVPAVAPWGSAAARAVLGLRDRAGLLFGVTELWWPVPRGVFDVTTRGRVSAAVAGFADVLGLRLAYGPVGSTAPSLAIFRALDEITESALVVRPLRDADGTVADFIVVHMSPRYADPGGRPTAELAGLTLLEAYPASASGDGLFAMAERVLATGRAEHVTPAAATTLTGDVDTVQVTGVHAVPFFAGVIITWRPVGETEERADLLDHAQRLGRIGAWEENLVTGEVRWTESAFAVFGLDPRHALPIPTASLHSFVIAADRAPVRRVRQSLLHRREPAVAVFRIVRPDDTAIRQIRIFAEPVFAGDEVVTLRGAFQDVSSHYHTQVALAATQDQLADSEQRAAQEQELALRLQRAIMPEDEPPVEAAGVEVAVRYRPAEQGRLVAGDWYDALLLPDKEMLLVVGDITGHGIDAVTGMIAARNALRGLAATGAGPADLLRYLNYAACYLTEGIAGTVICGSYNPDSRVLRWARAGHLPPVLVRDGAAEMLPLPGGILLGLDPEAEYEEATLSMRGGDTLLLFTDGLVERRADSITDALREFTAAAVPTGRDVSSHADRIINHADSDTGDDACLVAIRIL